MNISRSRFNLLRLATLVAASMLLLAGWPASADDSSKHLETITASLPASWPPHYIVLPGEEPTGFAVEILNAVAQRAGYKVSYRVTETMREAYDLAVDGKVDLMPNVGIVPSRMDTFTFTDPVETFVVSIFVRTDTQDIKNAAELAGRRVAVVKRNMGLRLMAGRGDVESMVFDDIRSALFDLVAGRVDAMIYPAPVLLDMAQQVGIAHRIKIVGEPLLEVKRAIAIHPSRTEIHRRLGAAVSDFVGTPEYQEIYLRWFGDPPEYWTAARVLTVAGGALVLVVLGFSLWHYRTVIHLNKTLEERVEQRTSALRTAESELLRKERLATLGELTGTMAHELRNPLGSIVTSFTVIRNKLKSSDGELNRNFDRAERNIDRCTGIINDLLEYAQVRAPNREAAILDRLVRETVEEYSLPDGIALDLDLGLDDRTVMVDSEQIRRIILNFLDNSCQSIAARLISPDGMTEGNIEVRTMPADEAVELSVSDNGVGIPRELAEKIFEPLFSTKPFGVGLGLPNAQNIVSGHGGQLTLDSEPGHGARVTVRLPNGNNLQPSTA
jgi:signal transduction histidine kinase